ncbi:MAG: SAM domain-containing protein, partial [Puia sp.]|nr:SAM domain-containing protein [Puia sp.]
PNRQSANKTHMIRKKIDRNAVAAWVASIGLPEYSKQCQPQKQFLEYGLDESMLEDITDEILRSEFHMEKTLHRKNCSAKSDSSFSGLPQLLSRPTCSPGPEPPLRR